MNPFIARLAEDAAAPLEAMLARLVKTAALVALAAGCAIAASAFLSVDLYLFLEGRAGSLAAAGALAALYFAAAAILLLIALKRSRLTRSSPADVVGAEPQRAASVGAEAAQPEQAASAPPRDPAYAARVDAAVAPIVKLLRENGLDKEALAVEAGTAVAKQLDPLALTGFAMGAGVLIGRQLKTRRTLF